MQNTIAPIPISCSGYDDKSSPLKTNTRKAFRFMESLQSQNKVMKFVNYKPPRVVKGKHQWYVEYQYKNQGGKWQRFRIYENINRYRTEEYNQLLLKTVENALIKGYNPFEEEKPDLKSVGNSMNQELIEYENFITTQGLRRKTLQNYHSMVNRLREYFMIGNKIYQPPTSFTREDIKGMLDHYQKILKWSNSTFNKNSSQIGTFFLWLKKQGRCDHNPTENIDDKKYTPQKNTYYDNVLAEKLKAYMAANDPYLLSYCEFVYYTAIRPKSEGPNLKVKHILFDRDLIEVPGDIDKTNRNNFIPMDPELKGKLQHLRKAPGEWYIWSHAGPGPGRVGANFWSNKFKPVKKAMGLSEDYTIYSWKHTRAIHLANAGMDPFALMKLFRHTDFGSTMKYLRDLGANIDWGKYDKTRKF